MKVRQIQDELAASAVDGGRRRSPRFWWGWGLALLMTSVLVVLATLPPFAGPGLRGTLMLGFSMVCHQIAERSPAVEGIPLAVCHRCYGIYWGLLLAGFVFLALAGWDAVFNRRAPLILAAALVPTSLDWMLGVLGIWENTPFSRLLTGALLGIVAGYYLARALAQLFVAPSSSAPKIRAGPPGEVPVASVFSEAPHVVSPDQAVSKPSL